MASYDADLQASVDATSVANDAGTEDDLVQYLRDQLAEREIETSDDAWLERMIEGIKGDRNYLIESEPSDFTPRRRPRGLSPPRRRDRRLDAVDFFSAYDQGFARVAACTVPVAIADPARNAETVLEQARACHEDGVVLAVFPELSLCGYAIDDLLMQDTLLEAVTDAIGTIAVALGRPDADDRGRGAAGPRHPRPQLRGGDPPRPGARGRAEVLPADLPRVLRAPLVRSGRRPAR